MSAESASTTSPKPVKPVIEERIYVGNVDYKATEEELKELFASTLNVTEVEIPFKEITRGPEKVIKRHLGFAFVQFATKEDADKAIEEFSGQKFHRRNIFIKKAVPPPTEEEKKERIEAYKAKKASLAATKAKAPKAAKKEEKETAAPAAAAAAATSAPTPKTKKAPKAAKTKDGKVPEGKPSADTIFITNLDYKVDVKTLNAIFKELKPKWIHVPSRRIPFYILKKQQAEGRPRTFFNKGIAFVKFASEETQKKAVSEFNGKEVNGREIIVDIAIDARVPTDEEAEDQEVKENSTEQAEEASA